MKISLQTNSKRYEHVDVLRGLALMLILLLHAHGKFGIYLDTTDPVIDSGILDDLATRFTYLFVRDKAFAVFSLLFGFSFFIQLDRTRLTDREFNVFFILRMLLLLIIGLFNASLFRSDILTKYAVVGLSLLLFNKLKTRYLLIISIVLLLQPLDLINLFYYLNQGNYLINSPYNEELWNTILSVSMNGSIIDLTLTNLKYALPEIWKLNFTTGRIVNILGYFLLGVMLGRSRILENLKKTRYLQVSWFGIGVIGYLLIRYARGKIGGYSMLDGEVLQPLVHDVLTAYMNFFMVFILLSGVLLLYQAKIFRAVLVYLKPYGRMSLSSYILQGFTGVIIFYGFGFGRYEYFGPFLSLLTGFSILIILLVFSNLWLRHHRYGPFEWLWRKATYRIYSFIKE